MSQLPILFWSESWVRYWYSWSTLIHNVLSESASTTLLCAVPMRGWYSGFCGDVRSISNGAAGAARGLPAVVMCGCLFLTKVYKPPHSFKQICAARFRKSWLLKYIDIFVDFLCLCFDWLWLISYHYQAVNKFIIIFFLMMNGSVRRGLVLTSAPLHPQAV